MMNKRNGVALVAGLALIVIFLVAIVFYATNRDKNSKESLGGAQVDSQMGSQNSDAGLTDISDKEVAILTQGDEPSFPNLNRSLPDGISSEDIEYMTELVEMVRADDSAFSAWLDLASYRKVFGDVQGAIEIWEYMTFKFPQEIAPYINLGDVYHYDIPNYELSEEYYKSAISLNNTYSPIYLNLHQLYKNSYDEKSELADDILVEGLQINPNDLSLLATLGEYFNESGDNINARLYYERLVEAAKITGDKETENRYILKIQNL